MPVFPFLLGGTFIEAFELNAAVDARAFPFLFGRAFIEAGNGSKEEGRELISLPFRRDFH